ncbi:MAG: S24 family peptidase, partial [Owenweeksia sp.]
EGNSMIPSILPTDKIICGKVEDINKITEGTICVVVSDKDIIVKRVYYSRKKADRLILKSDNADFKNIEMPTKYVKEIWQVQAKITNAFTSSSSENHKRMDELEGELKEIRQQLGKLVSKFNGHEAT